MSKTIQDIDGENIEIKEFKLSDMVKNPSIVVIAKRGSGKSWVCRGIIQYLNSIGVPTGVIISGTERVSPFYASFFPSLFTYYKYDPKILRNIFIRQTSILEKRRDELKKGRKVDPRLFLLMDDCLSDGTRWTSTEEIRKIFYEGRHFRVTFILTMQYPLGIGPNLRDNFDYVFLLADDVVSNQKRIYEHYAGIFPNVNVFKAIYGQITKDHGCMVIKKIGTTDMFLDKVFFYKAEKDCTEFGCKEFKDYNTNRLDKDWDKRKHSTPPKVAIRKITETVKKGGNINIKIVKNNE